MSKREKNIKSLQNCEFDALVLGGGINGAVSAASLSAKGAKVALIDKGDFAGFTSSNSSSLAWGGIKYLETHEYFLVNKLCKSRNHLMRSYPSTVKEIRFLTCIQKGFRFPPFFIYLGTLLYWLFGRFFTQAPAYLSSRHIRKREPVINTDNASGGFEYSDAFLFDNDARFVFNFIHSSMKAGCIAANYVSSAGGVFDGGFWTVQAKDEITGAEFTIRAKTLINACGPFVDQHNEITNEKTEHRHVFSKGVHLIVDQITDSQRVLAFFASDGRLFFVIPMGRKTCIGTTDTQVESPLAFVTEEDRSFILENVNKLLKLTIPLRKKDIIAERCGVRPLALKGTGGTADWVKLSRKHAIDIDSEKNHLSIFGGKLTDCINVGDEVSDIVADFGIQLTTKDNVWYGEADADVKREFFRRAEEINLDALTWDQASEPLSQRFWRRYGENALTLVERIEKDQTQAQLLIENAEYTRCEIEYAAEHEIITKLEDFLRRRSKISLVLRYEDIVKADGLKEACRILFGEQADEKLAEYIQSNSAVNDER